MTRLARSIGIVILAGIVVAGVDARQAPQSGDRRLTLPGVAGARRLALVIGNNAYPAAPLRNAVADAAAVSSVLRSLAFDVTTLTDADLPAIERAMDTFVTRLEPVDVALFYFSGHGVQVDGENYLMPVDFKGVDEVDLRHRAYSASRVHAKLEARARIRIIVLDACRDNPFKSTRSAQGGLAEMTARGSLIAFATGPGSTASDNPRGKNGLFTEKLLEALNEPGLSVSELFRSVRRRVNDASGGRQFPWLWDGLIGDFVFRPGERVPAGLSTDVPEPVVVRPAGALSTSGLARFTRPTGAASSVSARALRGNAGAAYGLSVSPGSRIVAAGYETGVIKIWDPGTGKEVGSLSGQEGGVASVAFSPDGKHLAATSGDHTVRLWDLDRQEESGRLVGHTDKVLAVAYSPDGRAIATASADGTIRTWIAETSEARDVLTGHRDWVTSVVFSRDGRALVSAGRDRTARIWDVSRARETATMDEARVTIWSIAVSEDLKTIAAGADDGTILVWDSESGRFVATFRAHKGAVWAIAFSRDGRLLASGGADGAVETWYTGTWQPAQVFRQHAEWVRGVAFDESTSWLVSSSGDGDLRTWRIAK